MNYTRFIMIMAIAIVSNKTLAVDASQPSCRVVSIIGTASIGDKPLTEGMHLRMGVVITTHAQSGVKLLMPDKTIIDIGANSRYAVNRYEVSPSSRTAEMTLDMGSVRASVQKKLGATKSNFYIRTKASVLAVRGTEFSVELDDNRHMVTVSEGKVDVLDAATQKLLGQLAIGHQALLSAESGKIQVSSIGAHKAEGWVAGLVVSDRTFQHGVLMESGNDRAVESATTIIVRSASAEIKESSLNTENIPSALGGDIATGTNQIPGMAAIPGSAGVSGAGASAAASIQIRLRNP